MAAEEYLSYVPFRNGEWKGHSTAKNVRSVIRANTGRPLRIFAVVPDAVLVDEDGDKLEGTAYVEIYPPAWPAYFAED